MSDLITFFNSGTLETIIIFIILILTVLKTTIDLFSYFYNKIKNYFQETNKNKVNELSREEQGSYIENELETIQNRLICIEETQRKSTEHFCLMAKDRIVDYHHRFKERGYIDDRSREYLEELFAEYETAGGNGGVHGLMDEIRELPSFEESSL